MALTRLDKYIADAAGVTRSQARDMIKSGRVSVDGVAVRTIDFKLDPEKCSVTADGAALGKTGLHYLMMNKPAGVVCATTDEENKTVVDLLTPELRRQGIFPVGRLDKDTTGLLLLTNDGDFAHNIISPKKHVPKIYIAKTDGTPDGDDVRAFAEGIVLRDGFECLPAKLEVLGEGLCSVTVEEGKYHQVKRMLASRGKPVLELKRIAIGELMLDEGLSEGKYRYLEAPEIASFHNL
jgi:16S rRNA pseudouridine516 synthase